MRGTKNPDLGKIVALEPDLVVANEEENRRPDLDALREAGLNVWVTRVRTVPEAFSSLRRLITVACGAAEPEWLGEAEKKAWSETRNEHRREAFVAIWRRPWMVVGRDTFAGDVLSRLGVDNVFADHPERIRRSAWMNCVRREWISRCCPTSPIVSPATTVRRPSPRCRVRWSAGAI